LIRSIRHTVLLHSGRHAEFAEELPEELACASGRDDRYAYLDLLRRSVSVHLAQDDVDAAHDALRRIAELRSRYPFLALDHLIMSSVVATLLYGGDAASAQDELTKRSAECRRVGMDRLPLVRVTLAGMEGDCVLADERESAGVRAERLQRLARALSREPITWAHGLAAAFEAGAAELLGNVTDATTRYRRASAAFDSAGLTTAAVVARYRLQRAQRSAAAVDDEPASTRPEEWLRKVGIKRPDRWASLVHSLY
jgi:hypothetical protein